MGGRLGRRSRRDGRRPAPRRAARTGREHGRLRGSLTPAARAGRTAARRCRRRGAELAVRHRRIALRLGRDGWTASRRRTSTVVTRTAPTAATTGTAPRAACGGAAVGELACTVPSAVDHRRRRSCGLSRSAGAGRARCDPRRVSARARQLPGRDSAATAASSSRTSARAAAPAGGIERGHRAGVPALRRDELRRRPVRAVVAGGEVGGRPTATSGHDGRSASDRCATGARRRGTCRRSGTSAACPPPTAPSLRRRQRRPRASLAVGGGGGGAATAAGGGGAHGDHAVGASGRRRRRCVHVAHRRRRLRSRSDGAGHGERRRHGRRSVHVRPIGAASDWPGVDIVARRRATAPRAAARRRQVAALDLLAGRRPVGASAGRDVAGATSSAGSRACPTASGGYVVDRYGGCTRSRSGATRARGHDRAVWAGQRRRRGVRSSPTAAAWYVARPQRRVAVRDRPVPRARRARAVRVARTGRPRPSACTAPSTRRHARRLRSTVSDRFISAATDCIQSSARPSAGRRAGCRRTALGERVDRRRAGRPRWATR